MMGLDGLRDVWWRVEEEGELGRHGVLSQNGLSLPSYPF